MSKTHYTDQAILEGIKTRKSVVVEYVYDICYPMIRSMILKNSGSIDDARDIFQDAMVVLFRKLKIEEILLQCSFNTYFYSICKHLWLQKLHKRGVEATNIKEVIESIELPEEDLIQIYDDEEEKYRLYQKHFVRLGSECQKLLSLFLKKSSMREITDIMGFTSEKYTKVRKYRCKEELKRRIVNDPDYDRLF